MRRRGKNKQAYEELCFRRAVALVAEKERCGVELECLAGKRMPRKN